MKKLRIFLVIWLVISAPAWGAGGFSSASSAGDSNPKFKPEQIVAFAKKVERTMAAEGARVAIVARMGRPLSEMPPGMHYTHVGFAIYSEITTADGRSVPGYAIQNLYQLDEAPNKSRLVQDYPVDFFSDVAELGSDVIIPSPELQKRLLKVIASPVYNNLHNPNYSVIANPYVTKLQNCTGFVLDVINSAIYETGDINVIKAAEKKYYAAQPVQVNPFKLLLGSMFVSEVSLSDQNGEPVTATFETIWNYLHKYDPGSKLIDISPS